MPPVTRVLSSSQLALLATHGEERTAAVGETLFEVGDETYPFIAILEGEVGDPRRRRPRDRPPRRLRLPRRDEPALRPDRLPHRRRHRADALHRGRARDPAGSCCSRTATLSDLLLSAFIERRELLQPEEGIGVEIVGPRDSAETRRLLEFARRQRLPHSWRRPGRGARRRRRWSPALDPEQIPLVRLPGGAELHRPSNGELSRALGIGLELGDARGGRPADRRRRPGRARRRRLRRLRGPRHAADREHGARRPGRHLAADRELPRLPRRDQRHRTDQPRDHPGAQVRRPHRRRPTVPRRSSPAPSATSSSSRTGTRSPPARCCSRPAPNTGACRSPTSTDYEGISVFYAAGPPEAQLCGAQRVGVVGGGNSAAQAAVWLARGGALVTLLHRRADLGETMSALPDRRARALRRRRPRPQRNRRAARRPTASSTRSP